MKTTDAALSSQPSESLAKRLAVLLFGSTVYVLFLGTFLYAIGFTTGFGVPKDINDGAVGSGSGLVIVNVLLMSIFAIQHTIMARISFKRVWTKIVHPNVERSIFVLLTCIILGTLFSQWRPLPEAVWSVQNPALYWGIYALSALGWGIVLVSTFLIDHFELFGLSQAVRCFRGLPPKQLPFTTRGLYKYVRHPLMLGFLIAFWSTPHMTQGHLLFACVITGYILVGVKIEERSLLAILGDDYRRYMESTPGLLPLWSRRSVPAAPLPAPATVAAAGAPATRH
jgi:protein-S-isoprenylcysteine O-methyltransferase Ste14